MPDTSWGFTLPSLAPSIGEAVQMGEQKRQRDLIQSERVLQQQQEDMYKRVGILDKATDPKDFLTDNAKVDAMVNQRLAQIKQKFSSAEFAKMPINVLYGQLQQELMPLMGGATSFKGLLAANKDAIAKMAKANPNLDVESLTSDMRDELAKDVLQIGTDGALNFKPSESWTYANKDLIGELTSKKNYDLSSAPFFDRVEKTKAVPFPILLRDGASTISGTGSMTRYHERDVEPNSIAMYPRNPQIKVRGQEVNGRMLVDDATLAEFETDGTEAEKSGFRKAWSERKDEYEKLMPKATDAERKRAMVYDILNKRLPGDTGGAKTIHTPSKTTINTGSKTDVTWRDTYEIVNDLLTKAKSTGGSVQYVDLPSDAQTAMAAKVRSNPKWKDAEDSDMAIAWYDGIPWVIVAEFDPNAPQADAKKWTKVVKADPQLFNIPSNRPFGQKAQAESQKKYGRSGGGTGGPAPTPAKPAQGSGSLN